MLVIDSLVELSQPLRVKRAGSSRKTWSSVRSAHFKAAISMAGSIAGTRRLPSASTFAISWVS